MTSKFGLILVLVVYDFYCIFILLYRFKKDYSKISVIFFFCSTPEFKYSKVRFPGVSLHWFYKN